MTSDDRAYFAQRAAEEEELAAAANGDAAQAHRKLQRVYLERASVGDRDSDEQTPIG
jgi:hypothetical protein